MGPAAAAVGPVQADATAPTFARAATAAGFATAMEAARAAGSAASCGWISGARQTKNIAIVIVKKLLIILGLKELI